MLRMSSQEEMVELSLFVMSMFRFPLKYWGYDGPDGLILLADDDIMAKRAVKRLTRLLDAAEVRSFTKSELEIENYRMAVHLYRRDDSVEKVTEFLENSRYLAIVVVGGIVPEPLKGTAYIVRYKIMKLPDEIFQYNEMRQKIIEDNERFLQRVQYFCQLNDAKKPDEKKSDFYEFFWVVMRLIVKILKPQSNCVFLHKLEGLFWDFWGKSETDQDRFLDLYDVEDAVKVCVIQAVEKKVVEVAPLENFSERMESYILYDDKSYFISENLLRRCCEPLEQTVSFLQLKKELALSGVLQSDRTEGNYTVKKVLYDATTGEERRLRFLRLNKEKFISDENLYLEELQNTQEEQL